MTESWICENGHPYHLIDGVKSCWICKEIATAGPGRRCRRNHLLAADHRQCKICDQYYRLPWRETLDRDGRATCPNGHEVTHETLLYSTREGKGYERKCRDCVKDASAEANAVRTTKAVDRVTRPAARDGWRERWICDAGHPKYRVYSGTGSTLQCLICKKVERSVNPRLCRRGHKFPAEERQCRLCLWYAQNPWLKELDEKGISTCPSGHEVSHETLCFRRRGQRRCPECHKKARGKAVVKMAEANTGKHNANRGKRYGVKHTFADWVVVYRLIEGRLDEVYQMKRGFTTGPTPMEEWIAYNSMNPLEGAHRLAYSDQYELYVGTEKGKTNELTLSFVNRWQKWGNYGKARKWKPMTMWELIGQE